MQPLLYRLHSATVVWRFLLMKDADLQIPYFPNGFTVSTAASEDTSEVANAEGAIPKLNESKPQPEKTALHIEVCQPLGLLSPHFN